MTWQAVFLYGWDIRRTKRTNKKTKKDIFYIKTLLWFVYPSWSVFFKFIWHGQSSLPFVTFISSKKSRANFGHPHPGPGCITQRIVCNIFLFFNPHDPDIGRKTSTFSPKPSQSGNLFHSVLRQRFFRNLQWTRFVPEKSHCFDIWYIVNRYQSGLNFLFSLTFQVWLSPVEE